MKLKKISNQKKTGDFTKIKENSHPNLENVIKKIFLQKNKRAGRKPLLSPGQQMQSLLKLQQV